MTTTPTTPPTPDSAAERDLSAAERHAQGLALLADTFQKRTAQDAYQHILTLSEASTIDQALGTLGLHVASVRHGTTIRMEMTEEDAMHILNTLLMDMDQWGPSSLPNGLPDETTLGQIADHASAVTALANALIDPSLDQERRNEAARAAKREADQKKAATRPQRPMRTIKPATLERIKALRGEFSDDPWGFDLMVNLMGTLTPSSDQETPAPAAAITPEPATQA